ncbi:MAG: P-loop NTPase fold protein, partial [Parvibaculales bacterium]
MDERIIPKLEKHVEEPINEGNPWEDDVLERQEIAGKLSNIVSTTSQPFVIGLSAPFGGGKTFFLKRWQQELQNAEFPVVYFNAWETDYTKDPLMAFFAKLEEDLFKKDYRKKINSGAQVIAKRAALN